MERDRMRPLLRAFGIDLGTPPRRVRSAMGRAFVSALHHPGRILLLGFFIVAGARGRVRIGETTFRLDAEHGALEGASSLCRGASRTPGPHPRERADPLRSPPPRRAHASEDSLAKGAAPFDLNTDHFGAHGVFGPANPVEEEFGTAPADLVLLEIDDRDVLQRERRIG